MPKRKVHKKGFDVVLAQRFFNPNQAAIREKFLHPVNISFFGPMKIKKLKIRLERNRPMVSVTLRMPEDVVDDLKRTAPLLGISGYQPLMRAYIGQCLRRDLEKLDNDAVSGLVSSLERRGVSESVIEKALAELAHGQ